MAVKTYRKAASVQLSDHINSREMRCGLGSPCSCATTLIDTKLVEILEKIRVHFGKPLTITSGYRCPSYNKSIGGATGSYHSKGQAADIVVEGISPAKVAAYAESIGVLGIGLYETAKDGYFTHVDTRAYKSYWYSQAQAYRKTFGGAAAVGSTSSSTATTAAGGYTLTQFITDVQKACGAGVDGLAGAKTLAATVTISKSKNRRHAVVIAVQKRLAALGYTQVGTADGVTGAKFDAALKAFQAANGCIQDGEATAKGQTWQKLLGMAWGR